MPVEVTVVRQLRVTEAFSKEIRLLPTARANSPKDYWCLFYSHIPDSIWGVIANVLEVIPEATQIIAYNTGNIDKTELWPSGT